MYLAGLKRLTIATTHIHSMQRPVQTTTDDQEHASDNGTAAAAWPEVVTTVSRGHVVRWLGNGWEDKGGAGWNAVPPGLEAGVVVRGASAQHAAAAARKAFANVEQVRMEKERMRRAEARFQEHIKRALDEWVRDLLSADRVFWW